MGLGRLALLVLPGNRECDALQRERMIIVCVAKNSSHRPGDPERP